MFLTIEQTIFEVEKQFIFSLDVQWPWKRKYPCSNLFLHHFPIGSDDSKIRHLYIYDQKENFFFIYRINYFEGSKTAWVSEPIAEPSTHPKMRIRPVRFVFRWPRRSHFDPSKCLSDGHLGWYKNNRPVGNAVHESWLEPFE